MSGISDFLKSEELSSILMAAIPEKYKNVDEWEFTINYEDKLIDKLELWKTKHRYNKDKLVLDLTKIFTEFQLKQFFLTVILKFESGTFDRDTLDN
jgi:hypothetical protein